MHLKLCVPIFAVLLAQYSYSKVCYNFNLDGAVPNQIVFPYLFIF